VQEDFIPLTRDEATVWDASHPRPPSGDAEERRVTSWWTRVSDAQMESLTPHDASSLDRFRDVVGGALAVMIGREAPGPADVQARAGESTRRGSTAIRHGLLMRSRWQEVTPFVELTPAQPSGATIVWLDEHGAKGLLNADGAPTAAVDAALSRGARVIGIDVFGTGAFLEHGGRNANRLLDGPPFAPYTFGYNSPLIIQRVADVLAALRFARGGTGAGVEPLSVAPQSPGEARDAPPSEPRPTAAERVYLVGFGRDAGAWALLARAAAPTLVDRVAVDTGGFRFASVSSLQDAAFLPGSVKYGDLPGFTALGAPGPLWLAGEGSAAPALVEAAYRAAGAPRALTVAGPKGDPGAAVEWLLRPR